MYELSQVLATTPLSLLFAIPASRRSCTIPEVSKTIRAQALTDYERNIGDIMIRDMQLLDAQATVVQNPTTNEHRMIISSKCGSKFVTAIREYFLCWAPGSNLSCKLIDYSSTGCFRLTFVGGVLGRS